MSLALNFLIQLKTLCAEELSKRGQNRQEAGAREALSVLRSGNLHGSNKPHRAAAGNRAERSDKSKCVSSLSKENVKKIPKKEENSTNSETKTYSCDECDFSSKSHSDYINHKIYCAHRQYIQCSLCSEKFDKAELEDHITSIHLTPDFFRREKDGSYNCMRCNVSTRYISQFKKHLETKVHQGLGSCKVCGLTVPLRDLSGHRKECHGKKEEGYECKICGSQYPSKMIRDRHESTVHLVEQQFECPECRQMFKRQDAVKRHLDVHHSDIRSHPCSLCKLSFKTKATLEEHVKNIHEQNRYQCEKCYRGFGQKIDFDNHVLTHQGFVFRCMVCGKCFPTYGKREYHFKSHLNARKQKINSGVAKHDTGSPQNDLSKFDSNMPCEMETPSPQNFKRDEGDLLFSSNCQEPVDGDDFVRGEIDISDSKENLEDQNVISVPRKKKVNVRGNSKNKSVKLDRKRKPESRKNTVCEESSVDTDTKCCNNYEKDTKEINQTGASKVFDSEKYSIVDVSLLSNTTSKTVKLVDNLPKNDDCCGFGMVGNGQAIAEPVIESKEFCSCSTDDSKSEEALILSGSPVFLLPSSTIPENVLFVDINNLPGIDNDVESFSSFRPDSSVAESTLIIDVDDLCNVEKVEVKDLDDAGCYPMELQYYEVQTECWTSLNVLQEIRFESDSVVSTCSTDGVSAYNIKGETDSGVSQCNYDASQDGPSVKKASTKRKLSNISRQQKSRRTSKSSKYPLPEKKVIMRNIGTDDDDNFVLPEFVIDEEE